jgi:hypothetical protein
MNHDDRYPEWLTDSLIAFNHSTTCVNEFELVDIAVDLHRQPDLPQRLDVLFKSLQKGFGEDVLVAGNFVALGYDVEAGNHVFPRFVEFGRNALAMIEWRKDDEVAAEDAFKQTKKRIGDVAEKNPQSGGHQLIVQIPYFIRKADRYAPRGELSYETFAEKFDDGQVIVTGIKKVESSQEARALLKGHGPESFEQRFVFTFGFLVTNGIGNKILQPAIGSALGYFIGAFLSWAGMGVSDSTRYIMAAAAARLAHYSHEFLKPFGELQDFINKNRSSISEELDKRLQPVLSNVKLLDLSSISKGFNLTFVAFRTALTQALIHNTTLGKGQDIDDGNYDLGLTINDVRDKKVRIELEGIPDNNVRIGFDSSFFDRIIRNLLRNAAQHSPGADQVRARLSVVSDRDYNVLTMRFIHLGSKIDKRVMRQLFRLPVPQAKSDAAKSQWGQSKGIGLWTVGMAFEAHKLTLPQVEQRDDGVWFIFRFPMKTQ